jgi:hypothetical protein
MDRNNLYILLGLIWMAFLGVGIAYVLVSEGAACCKGYRDSLRAVCVRASVVAASQQIDR